MPPDRPVRSASSRGRPGPAAAHPEVRVKPRLRGVSHQYAFFVSLGSGTLLVLLAPTVRASVAAAVPALMFTTLVSLAGILLVRLGLAASGRAGRAGGAVSSRSGRPQCLLAIPRRGRREPGELPRPEQNLTQLPGVDSQVVIGG